MLLSKHFEFEKSCMSDADSFVFLFTRLLREEGAD